MRKVRVFVKGNNFESSQQRRIHPVMPAYLLGLTRFSCAAHFRLFSLVWLVAIAGSVFAQDDYGGLYADDDTGSFGDESASGNGKSNSRSLRGSTQEGRGYRIGASSDNAIPETHTVKQGDTLWDVTKQYYGDPWQWPKVWSYNPEITNPHWIYPLDQIRLLSATTAKDASATGVPGAPGIPGIDGKVSSKKGLRSTIALRNCGYLDEEALHTVGRIFGSNAEHMMLMKNDVVYIQFSPDQQVQVGKPYTVFRKMEDDERGEAEQGTLVRIFGTVKIDNYDSNRHVARGTIEESLDPIERGYSIAILDTGFVVVPLKISDREVSATIIANLRPRTLVGSEDIVFIDAGEDKGVALGNQFFVIRKGDEWQQSLFTSSKGMGGVYDLPKYRQEDYPDEAVAVLRVIRVRQKTSVALVTRANIDVKIGDKAETRKGF
jgi:hypothetical protein